ncbi:MAG: transglutaminase family protein [Rhodopirellula sp. JB044]|uniref:transglutaminase-like domain-containing protein n=1 Tax=Rhodopirellula sp. JB044 TaxID=3342844 RepID=UPI00370CA65C
MMSSAGQSSDYRWLDNRFLLGCVIAAVSLFVGQTFTTTSLCITLVIASIAVGLAVDSRRATPVALSHPQSRARKKWWRLLAEGLALAALLIGALIATFQWRMQQGFTDVSGLLMLAVDVIAHYCVAVLCILWAIWPHRGHVTMLVAGLVAVLVSVAGGGVSRSLPAQTAVGLASMIGFVVAAQIILSRQKQPHLAREQGNRSFHYERWPYTLATLSLVLIVASAITQITGVILPDVQAEVFAQLKDRFEDTDTGLPVSSGGYVSGHRLGSVRRSILNDPEGLALLGYCNASPGYLRGNVFDEYQQRSWRSQRRWLLTDEDDNVEHVYRAKHAIRLSDATVPLKKGEPGFRSRFSLVANGETGAVYELVSARRNRRSHRDRDHLADSHSADHQDAFAPNNLESSVIATVEIHGQPERGAMIFLPSATSWVEARGDRVGVTSHGLIDRGIDTSQPWVAGVTAMPRRERLTERARDLMTSVDDSLTSIITPLATEICQGAASAHGKADRIASFFQNNFSYTLQTESAPSGVDPISYFLRTRHPAHCELFASASTLMLRSQGVPARYVTGYVMDEISDSEEYFIARNRDAHAWVEYYDDEHHRWHALEATPGRVYQTLTPTNTAQATIDLSRRYQQDDATHSGWFSSAWGNLMSVRVTDALALFFRVLQLPLLAFLLGWLWWRRRSGDSDSQSAALAAARRSMDRRLRRWGWVRRDSETLHQFANRIEMVLMEPAAQKEHPRHEELAAAAIWYREHAVKLYRCS